MSTDTDQFTYTRTYALPPVQLWHLLTDADMRAAWGCPDPDIALTPTKTDLTVGGTDVQRAGPEDTPAFEVTTRWYNLNAPTDVVFTEVIHAEGADLGASLVTYRIAEDGTGSALAVTVAVTSFVGPEMIGEFNAGWDGGMANLDALVAAQSKS